MGSEVSLVELKSPASNSITHQCLLGLAEAADPSGVRPPAPSNQSRSVPPRGGARSQQGSLGFSTPALVGLRFPAVLSDKLVVQDTQLFYEFSSKVFCISVNIREFPNVIVCLLFLSNLQKTKATHTDHSRRGREGAAAADC